MCAERCSRHSSIRARLSLSSRSSSWRQQRPWQRFPAEAEGLRRFSCKTHNMEGTGMSPGPLALASAPGTRAWPGWPGQRLQEQELRPGLPGAQAGPDCCPGAEPPRPRGLGPRAGQEAQEPRGLPSFAAPCRLSGLARHHLGPRLWWLLAPAAVPHLSPASPEPPAQPACQEHAA